MSDDTELRDKIFPKIPAPGRNGHYVPRWEYVIDNRDGNEIQIPIFIDYDFIPDPDPEHSGVRKEETA